jgi:hypothetical protein
VLSGLLWLWTKFVVQDTIFEGKRKTIANRVSPPSRQITHSFSEQIETETLTIHSKVLPQPEDNPPLLLRLKYAQSTNGGKSLINQSERVQSISFGEVFDTEGVLHKRAFASLLKEMEGDLIK